MRGYRKDPEKTAEAIDGEGWLHTGDIGTVDADGYVSIVDRKKDLIINSSGKNMSPANIENTVRDACPLAGVVVAIADQRPFVSMLIVLDPDAAGAFAARHGIADASPAALARNAELLAVVQASIDKANTKLSKVEHVRAFTVLPEYWLPGSDVLTPTMKVRRKPVAEIYASVIDAMYAR
jgi:long-subunit acyl-CoA synthetase (AMP-forming)